MKKRLKQRGFLVKYAKFILQNTSVELIKKEAKFTNKEFCWHRFVAIQ